jgi:hypothetical protein
MLYWRNFEVVTSACTHVWDKTVHTVSLIEHVHFSVILPTVKTMESTIFCDVTPWSPVEVHQRFGGTNCLHLQGCRVSQANKRTVQLANCFCWFLACLPFSSTLKMEAMCCSETRGVLRTTGCYNPEDHVVHGPYCENFRFNEMHIPFPSTEELINTTTII